MKLSVGLTDDLADIPSPTFSGYSEDACHSEAQRRQTIAAHRATVSLIDHQVDLQRHAREELDLERSAIVLFVSARGFHLGEHGGLWRKHIQFEESIRVPLIVRVPGIRGGRWTSGLVELSDPYPTLVDPCGLPQPEGLAGASIGPLLENPERSWKSAIFPEAQRNGAHGRSVRTVRYRFTEWTPCG